MKSKKKYSKIIVVDSDTLTKGFSSHINESGDDPVENADNFFEGSDEELLLQNSFAPGRIKMDNLMDGAKPTAKNAHWRNSFLGFLSFLRRNKGTDRII